MPAERSAGWFGTTLLTFFYIAGAVVGLAPVLLLLGRLQLLLYFAPIGALVQLVLFLKFGWPNRRLPARGYLLEFIGALFPHAMWGFAWMMFYGLTLGLLALIRWVAGGRILAEAAGVAFWVSLPIGALTGIGALVGHWQGVRERLVPPESGPVVLYPGWDRSRLSRMLPGAISLSLILALCWRYWPETGFYIALQFALAGWTAIASPLEAPSRCLDKASVVRALAKLLEAAGFQVDIEPRTSDEDIDHLLGPLDLYARRLSQALAISVVVREAGGEVGWSSATELRSAAFLYGDDQHYHIEPLLVLLGRQPSDSLKQFAASGAVLIRQFEDDSVLRRVLATSDTEELRRLAEEYLLIREGAKA